MVNPFVQTEGRHPSEVVLSEANGARSRDAITIASGAGVVKAGTVVGKITATGKWVPSPLTSTSGEEGAETAKAVTLYGCDATSADQKVAALTGDCEVNGQCLEYHATALVTDGPEAKAAELAAVGIKVR